MTYRWSATCLSNKLNCEAAFGCDFRAIRSFIGRAIGGPLPPVVVERAPAHEQVHRNGFDIGAMLPVLTHTPADGGRFITAGVVIARDPETGVYNASYHRLQLLGAPSHRDQARLRPPPAARLRARQGEGRASADRGVHRRRHRAPVHRRHHGLADAGKRRRDRGRRRAVRPAAAGRQGGEPGPAGDGGHRDRARRRDPQRRRRCSKGRSASSSATSPMPRTMPIVEVTALTHRRRPVYHAINGYGRETIMLRKYVLEASLLKVLARRGAVRRRRRDDRGRPAPLPRRHPDQEVLARPTRACSATPSSPRSARSRTSTS